MNDEIVVPLDPIYAIGQKTRTVGVKVANNAPRWNRWRESLPDRCWNCGYFDKCTPYTKCRHNTNK